MKIAIISDVHDNLPNLNKCLAWCRQAGIEALICCGDLTNAETLQTLAEKFPGKVWLIRGNADIYEEERAKVFENIEYLGRYNRLELKGKYYGICHEPFFAERVVSEYGQCELIFYGHTHKPWIEDAGSYKMINPGTLGGVFQKATFAVFDAESGGIELKVLELL